MKTSTLVTFLALAVLSCAAVASARMDLPRPDQSPAHKHLSPEELAHGPMTVVLSDEVKEAELEIPRDRLGELGVAPNASASLGTEAMPPMPTIVSGVAMSLAIVTGGLWLVRARRRL